MRLPFLNVLSGVLFFNSVAFSQPTPDIALTNWNELPVVLQQNLKRSRAAAVQVDFEQGEQCSGTFISSDGQLLTAGHCASSCLASAASSYYRANAPLDYLSDDHEIQSVPYPREVLKGARCGAILNGKHKVLTFLGGGKGSLSPFFMQELENPSNKANWLKAVSEGYGPGGDFALFQVEHGETTPCLPLGAENVEAPEVYSIASTCIVGNFYRGERNGSIMFYSRGHVLAEEEPGNKLLPGGLSTLNSSLHAEICSSGSGVITPEGVLVGVTSQANSDPQNHLSPSSHYTQFVRASFIKKLLNDFWHVKTGICKN